MVNRNIKYQVLRKHSEFKKLFSSGKRLHPSNWMIINYNENKFGLLRCGWTISGKVGPAVVRNKLKRWCREFFRNAEEGKLPISVDLNIVIRVREENFYRRISRQEFFECLHRSWSRLAANSK